MNRYLLPFYVYDMFDFILNHVIYFKINKGHTLLLL